MRPPQIRSTRRLLRLTQQELADQLGVHKSMVSLWETGRRRLTRAQNRDFEELFREYFPKDNFLTLACGDSPVVLCIEQQKKIKLSKLKEHITACQPCRRLVFWGQLAQEKG